MRKKRAIFLIITLVLALGGFLLIKANVIFGSHTAVVNTTITDLLEDNAHQLPKQSVDLAMLNSDSVQDAVLTRVADWQVENVVLQNTVPIAQAIFDDDPVYGLKADLLITYVDGTQATLSWESWRYGLVLGPIVLSLGDGPPGYIVAATVQ
ncbi:MAG: hypothetical protein HF973_00880 [Chloroflexi bacterium]|nr:hypothetical protein [Chloroflexota bacterium]